MGVIGRTHRRDPKPGWKDPGDLKQESRDFFRVGRNGRCPCACTPRRLFSHLSTLLPIFPTTPFLPSSLLPLLVSLPCPDPISIPTVPSSPSPSFPSVSTPYPSSPLHLSSCLFPSSLCTSSPLFLSFHCFFLPTPRSMGQIQGGVRPTPLPPHPYQRCHCRPRTTGPYTR